MSELQKSDSLTSLGVEVAGVSLFCFLFWTVEGYSSPLLYFCKFFKDYCLSYVITQVSDPLAHVQLMF